VRQKIRWGELLTAGLYEQQNRFKIMIKPPSHGDNNRALPDDVARRLPPIFWAVESSNGCERQCCHNWRSFRLDITNAVGQTVLVIDRPFRCSCTCNGCFACNAQEIRVRLPGPADTAPHVGRIVQSVRCCSFAHYFDVLDEKDVKIYEVRVPFCECWAAPRPGCCCSVWAAEVWAADGEDSRAEGGEPVAHIQNIWPGCNGRGLFTKADNFQVNDHREIPGQHKFLILASLFLLDMIFFEVRTNQEKAEERAEIRGLERGVESLAGW
jgi:hypothetical protein